MNCFNGVELATGLAVRSAGNGPSPALIPTMADTTSISRLTPASWTEAPWHTPDNGPSPVPEAPMSDSSGAPPPGLVDSTRSSRADAGMQGGQPSPVDSSSSEEDGGRKGSKNPDGKRKYKGGRISDGKSKDEDSDGKDTVRGKGKGKSKDKTRARGGGERDSDGPLAGGERESDARLAVGGGRGGGGPTRARVKAPPVGLAPPRPGSHHTVKAPPPMGPVPREEPAAEPGVGVPPPAPPGVADPPRRRT